MLLLTPCLLDSISFRCWAPRREHRIKFTVLTTFHARQLGLNCLMCNSGFISKRSPSSRFMWPLKSLISYLIAHHNHNLLPLVLIFSRIKPRFHRLAAPFYERHDSSMSNLPWEWNNRSKPCGLSRNLLLHQSQSSLSKISWTSSPAEWRSKTLRCTLLASETAWISPLLSAYKQKLFSHLRHRLPTF